MLERAMIISGESSGELYGALLARSLKKRNPDIQIIGVGGSRMRSEGVDLIAEISGAFGLLEALIAFKEVRQTFKKVIFALSSFRPQVLILIDYPDFNFKVAKKAKEMNIKILYYVSPQIWAWRSWRIHTLKKLVDMMALILPFEEDIYRKAGIPHEFVGHPVMDEIADILAEFNHKIEDLDSQRLKEQVREAIGINHSGHLIAMLPGSRRHEIIKILPVMTEVINELSYSNKDYQFVIPIAPNLDKRLLFLFNSLKNRFSNCHILGGDSVKALLASDIAVITSGTATLQSALLGIPATVVYKLSPLSYMIGRRIINVRHISLINLLADKSLHDASPLRLREMLQEDANKDNIIDEISRLTHDKDYVGDMKAMFYKIRLLFTKKQASSRVAEIAANMHSE